MLGKENEKKKYTAELWTPRKHLKAENGGQTHDNKIRNCLRSLLNQYMSNYDEVFKRWSDDGWIIRKHYKSLFPDEYARVLEIIKVDAKWTFDTKRMTHHGILSHTAMENAVRAVFA